MSSILPGVYIERVRVAPPVSIVTPTTVYMVGLPGTGGTETTNTIVAVNSVTDFETKFGTASSSLPDVVAHFNQSQAPLNFIAVELTTANDTQRELDFGVALDVLPDDIAGILVCPRAFTLPTTEISYTNMVTKLANTSERTGLFLILDVPTGYDVAAAVTYVTAIKPIERCAVYYPYLTQGTDTIPPSSVMASIAANALRTVGIAEVPAGERYPLKGVTLTDITREQWESLYNIGVNVIRNRRGAVVAMGARTIDSNMLFINTSIILSSIQQSLSENAEPLLFQQADNRGELFNIANGIAHRVMNSFFDAGALLGTTPRDAFRIICDNSNNTSDDLAAGKLTIWIDLQPATAIERVFITPSLTIL